MILNLSSPLTLLKTPNRSTYWSNTKKLNIASSAVSLKRRKRRYPNLVVVQVGTTLVLSTRWRPHLITVTGSMSLCYVEVCTTTESTCKRVLNDSNNRPTLSYDSVPTEKVKVNLTKTTLTYSLEVTSKETLAHSTVKYPAFRSLLDLNLRRFIWSNLQRGYETSWTAFWRSTNLSKPKMSL